MPVKSQPEGIYAPHDHIKFYLLSLIREFRLPSTHPEHLKSEFFNAVIQAESSGDACIRALHNYQNSRYKIIVSGVIQIEPYDAIRAESYGIEVVGHPELLEKVKC